MNVVKTAFKGEPYDQGYLYELEASKINEMMRYNMEKLRYVGVENVIRNMRICLSLIDIFSGKRDIFHFDGGFEFVESEEKDEKGEKLYEIKETPDFQYHCDVTVNTKNVARFVPDEKMQHWYIEHPHELYILKARRLYHLIRYYDEENWWD